MRGTGGKRDHAGRYPPNPSLDHAIGVLAGSQHNVVALGQLRELGLGDSGVRKRVGRGRLHRVHSGVYAVGHASLTAKGRWMAAVLACGDEALLSHRAAGALRGLRPDSRAVSDFLWRRERLIVETDGHATHRTRNAFERDRERDQRLMIAGWRVLRFTWRQLTREPDRVSTTLRALLSRASA